MIWIWKDSGGMETTSLKMKHGEMDVPIEEQLEIIEAHWYKATKDYPQAIGSDKMHIKDASDSLLDAWLDIKALGALATVASTS